MIMKKKEKDKLKIRKPVPKKAGRVIMSKKDKERKKRLKHKNLVKDIDS